MGVLFLCTRNAAVVRRWAVYRNIVQHLGPEHLAPTLCIAEVHAESVTESVRVVQGDSGPGQHFAAILIMELSYG